MADKRILHCTWLSFSSYYLFKLSVERTISFTLTLSSFFWFYICSNSIFPGRWNEFSTTKIRRNLLQNLSSMTFKTVYKHQCTILNHSFRSCIGVDHKKNLIITHKKNPAMVELKHHFVQCFCINMMRLSDICQRLRTKDIHLSMTWRFRDHVVQLW